MATTSLSQLDISGLDPAVQYFCAKGLADSTHKVYQSALRRFTSFCSLYSITTPFLVSEAILCYYAAYLAGIRHTQILLGLPEPREFSSLPRLRLVQSGIQCSYSQKSPASNKIRLPITPAILLKIRNHWISKAKDLNTIMLWAAATVCFFGFFRAGEITTTGVTSFSPTTDLAWGDVTIDNSSSP